MNKRKFMRLTVYDKDGNVVYNSDNGSPDAIMAAIALYHDTGYEIHVMFLEEDLPINETNN